MPEKQVCAKKRQSKTSLHSALAAGWSRVAHAMGRAHFIEACDFDNATFTRAIAGPSMPSAENLLNSLAADPTALDEILSLYGLRAGPAVASPANDYELLANLAHTLAEMVDRLRDGKRCHVDTAVLAPLFRQLMPQMQAIIDEDDHRKVRS